MSDLTKISESGLRVMLSEVAEVLSKHTQEDSEVSMYWYLLYQKVQKELDKRLISGGYQMMNNKEIREKIAKKRLKHY